MARNTHCSGYYQHECGLELTADNRHWRFTGKCDDCGRKHSRAKHYKDTHQDVPQWLHDGNFDLSPHSRPHTYARQLVPLPKEIMDACEANKPWMCGHFEMVEFEGIVRLRWSEKYDADSVELDKNQMMLMIAWLQRKIIGGK